MIGMSRLIDFVDERHGGGAQRGPPGGPRLSDEARGSREAVELFFAVNALTFVVGWSWVVLLRDVSTLTAVAASAVLGAHQVWARTLLSGSAGGVGNWKRTLSTGPA